jgi:hypothetical protein
MPRIFTVLVALDAFFLVLSYVLGCTSRLTNGVNSPETRIYWYHFLCGLTTNVLTLLVHCLIFTYFLGTGRWVKEVTLAYEMPDEPLHKLTRELKRRVFPPALYAMLFAIASGATGAAAHVRLWPWYVHFTLATCTLLVNFWAFRIEFQCLDANVGVLRDMLLAVDKIRIERGLPVNEVALREES